MKRKTARDFEDVLQVRFLSPKFRSPSKPCDLWLSFVPQCAIPAFDSLLPPEHDSNLLKLLYICAQWHALAKLRLHNDFTLSFLEYTTTLLGAQIRTFHKETCSAYDTRETQKEVSARGKKAGNGIKGNGGKKKIQFDVYTIKFHFLGDYVRTIRQFGTTDSFSTETVSATSRVFEQETNPRHARVNYRIDFLSRGTPGQVGGIFVLKCRRSSVARLDSLKYDKILGRIPLPRTSCGSCAKEAHKILGAL